MNVEDQLLTGVVIFSTLLMTRQVCKREINVTYKLLNNEISYSPIINFLENIRVTE